MFLFLTHSIFYNEFSKWLKHRKTRWILTWNMHILIKEWSIVKLRHQIQEYELSAVENLNQSCGVFARSLTGDQHLSQALATASNSFFQKTLHPQTLDKYVYSKKIWVLTISRALCYTSKNVNNRPFHADVLFLNPMKTSKIQKFSDLFRGYINRITGWNV